MNKQALLIALIVFMDTLSFGIVVPITPVFIHSISLENSGDMVAVVMGIFAVTQIIFSPILGKISDKYGRKPILLFGLIGNVVCYLLTAHVQDLNMLIILRAMAGVFAATIGTAMAAISDIATEKNRTALMGMAGASIGLGFVLGPLIGGYAAPTVLNIDVHKIFFFENISYISAVSSFISLLLTFFVLKETRSFHADDAPIPLKEVLKIDHYMPLVFISFLSVVAFASFEVIYSLYARTKFDMDTDQIGLSFFAIGMMVVIVQGGLIRPLSKKYSNKELIKSGTIITIIGYMLIILNQSVTMSYIALMCLGLGIALVSPAMNSFIASLLSPNSRGVGMSFTRSATSLSRLVAAVLSGVTYQHIGHNAPFLLAIAVSIGMLIVLRGVSHDKSEQVVEPTSE